MSLDNTSFKHRGVITTARRPIQDEEVESFVGFFPEWLEKVTNVVRALRPNSTLDHGEIDLTDGRPVAHAEFRQTGRARR